LLHFVNHAAEITFMGTNARMSQIGYFGTMVAFLVTATFHGVNGVYNALINQGRTCTKQRAVKWTLVFASIVLVAQGIRTAIAMAGF